MHIAPTKTQNIWSEEFSLSWLFCLVGLAYFAFKEAAFCIKKQSTEYLYVLQNPDKFSGKITGINAKTSCLEDMTRHTSILQAASLSKVALKLVFDEASPDQKVKVTHSPHLAPVHN